MKPASPGPGRLRSPAQSGRARLTPIADPHSVVWQDFAACAEVDPDLWYPEKGGGGGRQAKKICAGCPVRAQCLEYALEHSDGWYRDGLYPVGLYGIWGGLSPEEREGLLQERRAA